MVSAASNTISAAHDTIHSDFTRKKARAILIVSILQVFMRAATAEAAQTPSGNRPHDSECRVSVRGKLLQECEQCQLRESEGLPLITSVEPCRLRDNV